MTITRNVKTIVIIGVFVLILGLIYKFCSRFMQSQPPGYDGRFSIPRYDSLYMTAYDQDSLITLFVKEGFVINRHHNDLEWDSISYRIGHMPCDTQRIEPFIRFKREKINGLTTFRILWIEGPGNISFDTSIYDAMGRKYYKCIDAILKRYGVTVNQ